MSSENSKLKEYIDGLEHNLPSDIQGEYLLELERFVNDLYLEQAEKDCPFDITEALLNAIGLAGSISYQARKMPNHVRDADFFKSIKKLSQLLKILEYYLSELDS